MKKLLLLLSFCFSLFVAFASHINGGQIDYKSLGNQKYEVTVTVYRDCNGIQISNSPAQASCSAGTQSFALSLIKVTDVTGVAPGCSVQSRCSGSYAYGLQEQVFSGVVDLSALNCCEVTLSWEQCCRPSNITTGASATNFYTEAFINKCLSSSLKWTDFPAPFLLPVGQNATLNYSASDSLDFDSISYKLIAPYQAAGSATTYSGSFSAQRPVTFLGFPNASLGFPAGFHFDNTTGNIKFRPTTYNQFTTWVVEATKWRTINGTPTIIGRIWRENTIATISSTNKVPYQNSPDEFLACGTDTSVAIIDFSDDDGQDFTVNLRHNLKWAQATLLSGSLAKKIMVKYVADTIPPGGISNAFTLEIMDKNCTPRGRSVKTYRIKDGGSTFNDSSYIITNKVCNEALFSIGNKQTASNFIYSWAVTDNQQTVEADTNSISFKTYKPGWVKGQLYVTSSQHCSFYTYSDSVYFSSGDLVSVSSDTAKTVCNSSPVSLSATPVYGQGPYQYKWSSGDTIQNITLAPSKAISYVIVEMTDVRGCSATDTSKIYNYDPTITITGYGTVCKNDTLKLTATISDAINVSQFGWDGFATGDSLLREKLSANKLYTFRVKDGACTFTKNKLGLISEPVALYLNDTAFCIGDSVTLEAQPTGGIPPYTIYWDTYSLSGPKVKISTQNATPGNTYFVTTITDSLGCINATSGHVLLNPVPVINTTALAPVCSTSGLVDLSATVTPSSGLWFGPGVNINGGTDFSPTTAGAGLHSLKYKYIHPVTNCSSTESVYQRVVMEPVIGFTTDSTTVIKGSKLNFTNTTVTDTTFASKWVFTGPQTQVVNYFSMDAAHTFADTGKYTVTLAVNNGICSMDSLIKTEYIHVYVPVSPAIGIPSIECEGLALYPNPAKDFITVEFSEPQTMLSASIADITGKEINGFKIEGNQIMLHGVESGVYFIKIFTESNRVYYAKIIIE